MTALTQERRGDGEPLLLIHGIGGAWTNWSPVLDALAERHDVLAIDLPGFGGSAPLAGGRPATIPNLAGAVEAELDGSGIDRAHIAGNSMGGWIALELAARGRAITAVPISPVGCGRRDERAVLFAQLATGRAAMQALPRGAMVSFAQTRAGRQLLRLTFGRPDRLDAQQIATFFNDYCEATGFASALRYIVTHCAENLADITCPTRVMWGTKDHLIPFRQAHRFVEKIGDAASLCPLDGLGHAPMSDDPDEVATAILDHTTSGDRARAQAAQP